MCGRYSLNATPEQIAAHFDLARAPKLRPSFNIPPGQTVLGIVELEDQSRKAVQLVWGLVPSWAKDAKNSAHLINARAETVRQKPSFRAAFKHRRCLIPATGFYEWQATPSGKHPFNIHRKDSDLFAFAGLWEHWQQGRDSLYTCTILTAAAGDLMRPIHERMPVILPPSHYHAWLSPDSAEDSAYALLHNQVYQYMAATRVGSWVNNPLHNDERCIRPVD